MRPETYLTISNLLIFIGIAFTAIGGYSAYHFNQVLQNDKDKQSLITQTQLNTKITELLKGNSELINKIEPFERLATQMYPNSPSSDALAKLKIELQELKMETNRIGTETKPVRIELYGLDKKENNEFIIQFKPDKNQSLGLIKFQIEVPQGINNKILKLKPSMKGGAYGTGEGSIKVSEDGRVGNLAYSLLAFGYPTFEVTLDRITPMIISGNYLEKPVLIDLGKQ